MELLSSIAEFISIKLGLLELKFVIPSRNVGYTISNYRSILGFKSYILLGIIWLMVIFTGFIIFNIHYIIIYILGIILIKALVLNFYHKHFGFNIKSRIKLIQYIKYILDNKKVIIYFLLKLIIISVIIRIALRSGVSIILSAGQVEDNYVSRGLILILPLPIYNYLLNIVLKIIKKKKITSEDYYFYNKFVINNTNLYRITYILCISYIVMNYYYIYITIITTGAIFIMCGIWLYSKLRNKEWTSLSTVSTQNNKQPEPLKSTGEIVIGLISTFVALSHEMQDAAHKGYDQYYNPAPGEKIYANIKWKKIYFNKPGEYCIGNTINITNRVDPLYTYGPEYADKINNHKEKLNNSPILNMVYYQKQIIETSWTPSVLSFFSHDNFYGSVMTISKGKFFIINLLRKDLKGSKFIPSFYLPDNTVAGEEKVKDIADTLEMKYNIMLPKARDSAYRNGFMILTQAEPIDDKGSLFRVWRPSIEYTEPESVKKKRKFKIIIILVKILP